MVSEIFPSSPTYFQIQLQNDSFNSYVAGQTIIGRVVVELKDKLKIQALKIELNGKGGIHWEKEHYFVDFPSRNRRPVNPCCCPRLLSFHRPAIPDEETYIFQEKYLVGERADSPVTLPPGVHSFPYFFTLSPWLPSSFEGRHCHIRYTLQAKLERALFKDLKSECLKFTIKGILDLNNFQGIGQPLHVSEQKKRDLLCWKLWSVAFILNVEKTGYTPGETLKFSVKFNNSCSNVKLTPVKAYLIQKVIVRAPRAESAYETKLLKISGPLVEAGDIATWEGSLEIPHVEPSGLGLYPAQVLRFNIQYFLKVSAKNVFTTVSKKVGITIGTIPLRTANNGNGTPLHTVRRPTGESILLQDERSTQQFAPYQNLSEVFPPILNDNNGNSNLDNVNNANNLRGNLNLTVGMEETQQIVQNNGNGPEPATTTATTPTEGRNGSINTSLITLTEDAKAPLKRTDTPPPSYEEAIKKPSNRK